MKKKKKRYDALDVMCFLLLTLLAISIVIPFWNAIVLSLETQGGWVRVPFSLLPVEFTWKNYQTVFSNGSGLLLAYRNTILLTLIGTVVGMAVSLMVAYGFTLNFHGKKFFFYVMLFTMFFGGGVVPTYLMIRDMHLINNLAAIVLLSVPSTYNIIVMKTAFQGIPRDLPEAATLDGASEMTIFTRIMLPLQKPTIATFSLFSAVGYWNNWYWPTLILNKPELSVLQVFLRSIINSASEIAKSEVDVSGDMSGTSYSMGIQMATVFAVMAPIMLVYPFLQKYFVKGMLVGGVKM